MKETRGASIPVQSIQDSMFVNKQMMQVRVNNELSISKMNSFSCLSGNQKGVLKKECSRKLKSMTVRPSILDFLCLSHESKTTPHAGLFDLLKAIKDRCLEQPAVFRKEGIKNESKEILNSIIQNKPLELHKFSILTLASASKTYIRDYLDGIFDSKFLELALKYVNQARYKDLHLICKLFIFSLPAETKAVFEMLQEIIFKISSNSQFTRMTTESLTNILCLTLSPQSLFTNIEIVDGLRIFLYIFIHIDMNNVEGVYELIQN